MDKEVDLSLKSRQVFGKTFDFVIGAAHLKQLPADALCEIAFIGRSNVGKSSLINAVAQQKGLARTSGTPGCTRQINFFQAEDIFRIVDLPGYGFAKASKSEVKKWQSLIRLYLKGRANLLKVFLLIDSRHGVKDSDFELMTELDKAAVPYQIVLTKIDKIKESEVADVLQETQVAVSKRPACHPVVLISSSEKREGIDRIQEEVVRILLQTGIEM